MKIYSGKITYVWILLFLAYSSSYGQEVFQLNGLAAKISGDNCYRLTTATNTRYGSIWYSKKTDLTKTFDISANLYFGTKDGNGADGMTFTFQNECITSGGLGGSLGIGGVTPSVFVEFDNFQNTDAGDPTYDHIGLQKNGILNHTGTSKLADPVAALANQGNVENGQYWLVRILWEPSTATLKVFFNGEERLSYTGNIVSDVFSGNPYVYWGFTASTGGLNNEQNVCIQSFPTNVVKLNDISICQGDAYQASLPGSSSYSWSPNYMISNTTIGNPILSPLVTTEYIVTLKDQCNNTQTDTILVTVNPLPTVTLNNFTAVCNGSTPINLSGGSPAGGTYSGTGVSAGTFNPSTAGVGTHTITYSYTNSNQCTATASKTIEVLAVTNISLSAFSAVCINNTAFALTGGSPAGGAYSGPGVNAGTFNPATAGTGTKTITYSVTAGNGCVSSASSNLQVNDKPTAAISSPGGTVICSGTPLTLQASVSAGSQYQWLLNSSAATSLSTSNTTYSASVAGSYQLKVVNSQGCEDQSSVLSITSGTTPAAPLTASKNDFCPGETVTLSTASQAGTSITWYKNGTIISGVNSVSYVIGQAGTFTVKIQAADGCSATSGAVNLTQLQAPTATLTSDKQAFCPGTTVVNLTAGQVATASYEWYKDAALLTGENTTTLSAISTGAYQVKVSLPNGCSTSSSIVSLVTATAPQAAIQTSGTVICQGTPLTITAVVVTGASYTWYKNATNIAGPSASATYNATTAGDYYAEVKSNLGCVSVSNTLQLTLQAPPQASLSASSTQICAGSNQTLTANFIEGASYEWFNNSTSLGSAVVNDHVLEVNTAGNYQVKINNGCPATSNAVTMTILTTPSAAGAVSGVSSFCVSQYNESFSIAAVAGASNYLWEVSPSNKASIHAGQGTNSVAIDFLDQTVTVKVTPRNACGTGTPASRTVSLSNDVFCTLGKTLYGAYPTNACQGSTVTFYNYTTDQLSGQSIRWNFGANANPATANGNGPHQVTYSTTGAKTVKLEYFDSFSGFVTRSEEREDYITVNPPVNTSTIAGQNVLSTCSNTTQSYSVTPTAGSSYQWQVTSGTAVLSSGQGTPQVTLLFQGSGATLTVRETSAAGCTGNVISKTIDCSTVTALEDSEQNDQIKLHPNPAQGIVALTGMLTSLSEICVVTLYDAKGQVVYTKETNMVTGQVNENIDVSQFPSGLYTVVVTTDHHRTYQKLMVE